MAILLSTIRHRVNTKLRNTDGRRPSHDPVEVDMAICESYLLHQSGLPKPHVYTANAFTISAGASTFTLPTTSSAEYGGDVQIQLVSIGQFLFRISVEEMEGYRNGQTAAQLLSGASYPTRFALYEGSDQVMNGFCYPAAKGAEVCNLYAQMVSADLRATDLDTVSVALSRYAATGLVFDVAAELLESMNDEDLQLRRLNPRVAGAWRKEAATLFYRDEARRHDLEGAGRTLRMVP